jgi:hypothetical protein
MVEKGKKRKIPAKTKKGKKHRISAKAKWRIKGYISEGYSANKIQKLLKKQHVGIRRKTLLSEIRKIKHQKIKRNTQKYIPTKYRGTAYRKRVYHPRFPYGIKQVAMYGTVHGRGRRIQVSGSGKQLFRLMVELMNSRRAPKKQFLTIDADSLLNNLDYYLSFEKWDAKPSVRS